MMDTPDNFYAILGVPIDADSQTIKRAYRQLARRFHPDVAGSDAAVQMKRINRAYDVLSDPEKRLSYDTVIGGVIDLRRGVSRARARYNAKWKTPTTSNFPASASSAPGGHFTPGQSCARNWASFLR